ncbi:MAG: DUF3037 domain-containing protein [Solirubrobacteraceae bacterium]
MPQRRRRRVLPPARLPRPARGGGARSAGGARSEVADHLAALALVADGAPGGGPIAALPPSERFGWLAAPSSTIVQASEVHTGLCRDPAATLDALFARLVATPGAA